MSIKAIIMKKEISKKLEKMKNLKTLVQLSIIRMGMIKVSPM